MNNKTFLENYRANAPLSGAVAIPTLKEPGQTDSFVGTRGETAEGYGTQQNIIGATAISILLAAMGYGPEMIATVLMPSARGNRSMSDGAAQIRARSVDEGLNKPINNNPIPMDFLNKIKLISPDSSREEILKGLQDNDKIIEQTRNLINERRRRGYGL